MQPYHQASSGAENNSVCDLTCFVQLQDAGMMKVIWEMFQKTVPDSLQQLRQAAISKDWTNVRFISHKLKTSVGIIQIGSVLKNMSIIETSAKEGKEVDNILPLVNISIKEYQEILPTVRKAVEKEIACLQN
jgi:HPt (histidine-containing phosphotransfer) domain-containing protein